jgi:hypothetical protein
MKWDVELKWKSRKILQVLDNYAVHLHLDSLNNIQQGFLFPNITSLVQLMDIKQTTNSGALVRRRTIPIERPPLVGEVSANFSG